MTGVKSVAPERGDAERSLKAMGLKEDGPMTPAQKDLVKRMYRTMVLGESGKPTAELMVESIQSY